MSEPLAYLLTWTTYGTWLPGDPRFWVKKNGGFQSPDLARERAAAELLKEPTFRLSDQQRQLVEATIAAHCAIRGWRLHAINCRTNHVHVVVTAAVHPDRVVGQFKSWCTRRLNESLLAVNSEGRRQLWTEGSSTRYINDDLGLEGAITYVRDAQ